VNRLVDKGYALPEACDFGVCETAKSRRPTINLKRCFLKGKLKLRVTAFCFVLGSMALATNAHARDEANEAAQNLAGIPLSFEANAGQVDPRVRYLTRGKNFQLFLTDSDVVFSLHNPGTNRNEIIRMRVAEGLDTAPVAEVEVAHKSNYLLTRDSANWHTDVDRFDRVRYPDVYPGIDLVYYGTDSRQLEYDFVVKAGQDPSQIRLLFDGLSSLEVDEHGHLNLHTPQGATLVQKAPVLYQYHAGIAEPVEGAYRLESDGTVGFEVGSFDSSRTLIIDPVVDWATYFGSDVDTAEYIVARGDGIYFTGFTTSLTYPVTGVLQPVNAGGKDAFVTKLSADGSTVLFSSYLGGLGNESNGGSIGSTMAVDGVGNIYLTGRTNSGDFPVTADVYQSNLRGDNDFYVSKINRDGNVLVYSTLLGGDDFDQADVESGPTLAIDREGNAIILGYTRANLFPLLNPLQDTIAGGLDGLVAKLDARGSNLVFSTFLGGVRDDKPRALTVDSEGSIYITGRTDSPDFPSTIQRMHAGRGDVFVTKLAPDGSAITYSTFVGGTQTDKGRAIAVDRRGNVFVTGNTQSDDFPVAGGAIQESLAGGGDAFVTRLSPDGRLILFSTFYGGAGDDLGADIKLSGRSDVFISGYTESIDFPVTEDALQDTPGGGQDGYIAQFAVTRTPGIVYSSYLGGQGEETAKALGIVRPLVYVLVNTTSVDMSLTNAIQDVPANTYITGISID
jgi:hypothetical protein